MDNSDLEIRLRLQLYVLGSEDLRAFQRWFASYVWRAGNEGTLTPLARAVERYLAEYTNGHRSEPELRSLFAKRLEGPLVFDRSEVDEWLPNEAEFHFDGTGVKV